MPSLADVLDGATESPMVASYLEAFDASGITEGIVTHVRKRQKPSMPLLTFVQKAWNTVDPAPYVHGWHIEAICAHLEALARRDIRNLLINIAPRSSKSVICSVMFPAWLWTWWPSCKLIFASYSGSLSMRDSVKTRDLIKSSWYQTTFRPKWRLKPDQDTKGKFENTAKGFRMATSVGAMATGEGADILVGDDLHSVAEDLSETRADMESAVDFWQTVMPSRVTNPKETCKLVVGQRVAEDDISGVLLKQGEYEFLCIPMEYEEPAEGVPTSRTSLGWVDPRTTQGALMCPERYGEEELGPLRKSLGYRYYAQYAQRPTADSTTLFKRSDWKRYDVMPQPDWWDVVIQSWDFAVKGEETSDWCCGQVWGKKNAELVLLDFVLEKMDFPESVAAVRTLSDKWPQAYGKLIEDKANGSPVYQVLRGEVFGLIPINPQGQGPKRARAQAVSYLQRGGQCWVPEDALRSWGSQFIEAMARLHPWDVVDTCSQALSQLAMPSPALDKVRQDAMAKQVWQRKVQVAQRREYDGVSRSRV